MERQQRRPASHQYTARAPTTSITTWTVAPSRTTRQNEPSSRGQASVPARSYSRAERGAPRLVEAVPGRVRAVDHADLAVHVEPAIRARAPPTTPWTRSIEPSRQPGADARRGGGPTPRRRGRRQPGERRVGRRRLAEHAELQLHPPPLRPPPGARRRLSDAGRSRVSTTGSSSPIEPRRSARSRPAPARRTAPSARSSTSRPPGTTPDQAIAATIAAGTAEARPTGRARGRSGAGGTPGRPCDRRQAKN